MWSGIITTVAGSGISGYTGDGGPAIAASLYSMNYICARWNGDIYFSDQGGLWVRCINAGTSVITSYVGGGGGITGFSAFASFLQDFAALIENKIDGL